MWFFNYYARAIGNTMQTAVSVIASSLSTSSWKYLKFRINKFLDYAATHPNAKIRYHSSQMHIRIHLYASYLNESKARSRNGSFFYLSEKLKLPIKPNDPPPKLNAPVLVNSKIIDTVMPSVQESETGSGFISGKDDMTLRNTLHEMGHIQGPTPIQFGNIVVHGIITDTVVQHRSKAMDMLFIGFVINANKNNFMFIGNKENKSCRISIKISLQKTSHFSSTYLCTQYHPKTKKTLFKLPRTLQGCVQTHLPPTVKQPLDCRLKIPPVTVASVSNQQFQLTPYLSTFLKQTVQTRQIEPTASFKRSPVKKKQICR